MTDRNSQEDGGPVRSGTLDYFAPQGIGTADGSAYTLFALRQEGLAGGTATVDSVNASGTPAEPAWDATVSGDAGSFLVRLFPEPESGRMRYEIRES